MMLHWVPIQRYFHVKKKSPKIFRNISCVLQISTHFTLFSTHSHFTFQFTLRSPTRRRRKCQKPPHPSATLSKHQHSMQNLPHSSTPSHPTEATPTFVCPPSLPPATFAQQKQFARWRGSSCTLVRGTRCCRCGVTRTRWPVCKLRSVAMKMESLRKHLGLWIWGLLWVGVCLGRIWILLL